MYKVKVDRYEDRRLLTSILAENGYIVWIEEEEKTCFKKDCYVCWEEKNNEIEECPWCEFNHNEYLFKKIEELNAEYPRFCPWCGRKLGS